MTWREKEHEPHEGGARSSNSHPAAAALRLGRIVGASARPTACSALTAPATCVAVLSTSGHDPCVMTVAELIKAVQPALPEILTPEELAETTSTVTWAPHFMTGLGRRQTMSDDEPLRPEAMLEVRILGEHQGIWGNGDETAIEVYERVRSDLQDFVAESRFGWGQLRP